MKKPIQSRGRRRGQTAKANAPELTLAENIRIAENGNFSESAIKMLNDLDELFGQFDEKHPQAIMKIIRDAMTDLPRRKPVRGNFNSPFDFGAALVAWRKSDVIRSSILEILKRIAGRDGKYFGDVARLFGRADNRLNVADELRTVLCSWRLVGLLMSYDELAKELRKALPETIYDRRTVERACASVGFTIKAGQRGRPKRIAK
jgi:hypothetical protein